VKTNPILNSYDIIGDIHGCALDLWRLLHQLGYELRSGSYAHPKGRKAVFLGDYIDRGPHIREVLHTVRNMVESGNAHAILGNHEVNAIRYHTTGPDGRSLRKHSPKRKAQHRATMTQLSQREINDWIGWFAGLPLALDLGPIRAVHACWDNRAIEELNAIGRLEGDKLVHYSIKGTRAYDTISLLINGPEGILPGSNRQVDRDGVTRSAIRVKWWTNIRNAKAADAVFPPDPTIPNYPLVNVPYIDYDSDSPITFFGHYAIKSRHPSPITPRLACLDYGCGKFGQICAYRWDGETELDPGKFVMPRWSDDLEAAK
jgi:hypothetical protein